MFQIISWIQLGSTVFTVFRIRIVTLPGTVPADFCRVVSLGDTAHFHRHDAGRHRDDPVAQNHDHRREHLTQTGLRGDVAVAHGGERYDRPVDPAGDAAEAVLLPFYHIHQRADDDSDGDYGKDKHGDLPPGGGERFFQLIDLDQVLGELQHTENTQHSQDPNHQEILAAGQQHTDIGGEYGEQINNSIETKNISADPLDRNDANHIFYGEEEGKKPLQLVKQFSVFGSVCSDTVHHHHHHADDDAENQDHIKRLAGRRVSLKDDFMKSMP